MNLRKLIIITFVTIICLPVMASAGFRCGVALISKGEGKYLVDKKIKKCGEVLDREVIRSEDADMKKEIWFVRRYSKCYMLTFHDGALDIIGSPEDCR